MQNLLVPDPKSVVTALVVCLAIAAPAQNGRQEVIFRTHTPMGGDALILMPAKQKLQLLATMEAKELEGVRQINDGRDQYLRGPDGEPFRHYPRELRFRFSIGKKVAYIEKNPLPVETKDSTDEFQSNLRFQLKLYQGLRVQVVEPEEARIIGVPKNIPYDERIYSVRFKLPRDVSADERLKLEVYDRNGVQIAKFHVQLLN